MQRPIIAQDRILHDKADSLSKEAYKRMFGYEEIFSQEQRNYYLPYIEDLIKKERKPIFRLSYFELGTTDHYVLGDMPDGKKAYYSEGTIFVSTWEDYDDDHESAPSLYKFISYNKNGPEGERRLVVNTKKLIRQHYGKFALFNPIRFAFGIIVVILATIVAIAGPIFLIKLMIDSY